MSQNNRCVKCKRLQYFGITESASEPCGWCKASDLTKRLEEAERVIALHDRPKEFSLCFDEGDYPFNFTDLILADYGHSDNAFVLTSDELNARLKAGKKAESRIAELEAERDGLARLHNIAKGDCETWYVRFDELRERAETLQAQVTELTEAPEEMQKYTPDAVREFKRVYKDIMEPDECPCCEVSMIIAEVVKDGRKAQMQVKLQFDEDEWI